ncbi:hypothetical protein HMI54_015813 [Coelomomyces lativittatus]|nr:hypothetical protein HMI55_003214 [Coelomomyces lativittatus]KAJ1518481.1 hypothetical protein HMI54_015813 [Coelomomyces lativittatus]
MPSPLLRTITSTSLRSAVNNCILCGIVKTEPVSHKIYVNKLYRPTCFFKVATFEPSTQENKGKNGTFQQAYHKIVVWGPKSLAFIKEHVYLGTCVYIEGKLIPSSYKDKEGLLRSSYEIQIDDDVGQILIAAPDEK